MSRKRSGAPSHPPAHKLSHGLLRRVRGSLRLRRLQSRALAASRNGVLITGPAEQDHPILYVNAAFERTYGYPASEVVGRNCRFLQSGDRDQPVLEELREALRHGREFVGVVRNYHKNGHLIYNELSISPVFGAAGGPTHFVGVQSDVSGRVRVERDLRESEGRLRALLAHYGSEIITILEPNGTPRYESPAAGRALGYGESCRASVMLRNVHPEDRGRLEAATAEALATPGESPPVKFRARHADGSWRYFESICNNLTDDPEIRGVVVSTRDVTVREEAERARRSSDELFRAVVQNSSEMVKVVKPDGRMVYASPAFELALGYAPEQTAGMNVLDYVHPDDLAGVLESTRQALEELESGGSEHAPTQRAEYRFRHADGSWRCMESVGTYLLHDPNIEGVVINARDVTDRKRVEAELAESEARYRAVVEDQTELICRFSADLELTFVNGAYCRYFGKSAGELIGRNFLSFVPPEEHGEIRAHLARVSAEREPVTYEHRAISSRGEIRWQQWTDRAVFDADRLVEYQSVGRDITGRKRAEEALKSSEAHFRRVVESLGEGLVVTDADDLVLDVNSRMTQLCGYTREEMLGRPAYELLLPPCERRSVFERNSERLRRGEHESYEMRLRRKDGSQFWAGINATPYRDSAGEIVGTLGIITDITDRRQAEADRRESEERFRQLFEHSVDALFVHDAEGRIRDVNPEACRSTGYGRDELLSMRVSDLTDDLISPRERAERERNGGTLWQKITSGSSDPPAVHLGEHRRKDGSTFPIEVRVGGVDYGGERLILASARDITERRELEARLKHQAFHDELTGLPNRAHFMDRLHGALARAERSGTGVAVLFLDLDDFKLVNDSLGHSTGDQLLAAVARRLERCLRPGDMVARFGGDEFTVLLEDANQVENATLVAERMEECLRAPVELGEREIFVKASVGIAFSAAGRSEPESLMRDADATMYRVKAGGKGHYELSEPTVNLRALRRFQLENDLRRAAETPGESFVVHYQPEVSVTTGEITGMEALVRWRLPDGELVYPESFIPFAEESGLIVPIGERVLEEACGWVRGNELRNGGRPVSVSVNLSARQFREPDLVQRISRVLEKTGADPKSLVLEITESAVLEYGDAFDKLRRLKWLGVRVYLDDFGTGYSSLSYLKHLPVDAVKIDKSFIDDLVRNPEDTVLVSAIINLARALNLEVVAEGVQTSAQLARLRELECPQAQGYLFSGAVPAGEAAELVRARP